MKLSSSSFLFTALHVIVLSTEVIPSVADDPAAAPTFPPTTLNAGDYEIEVVVNEGDDSGGEDDTATDIIAGVDPFNVTSFFEVSNKYNDIDGELNELNEEDQENNIVNAITVEVYTTVIGDDEESEDDCSKGILIEDAGEFTISAGAVNHITDITYPSPRNDDYFVGATIVRLTNFMSNVIYVANVANEGEDTATGGTVEFCVRTSFKLEDETVSHIDSKKKIMVDLVGNFASLTVNNIVKADNKDFEVTVVKEINVETSVCNIRNEPVDAARTYKIGEQFRICVGPQEAALEEGYEIDNFVEVTCGSRSLVESGTTDGLTSIEALPLKNNRRAMKSVITTGYAVDGATTLSCTGKVSLSYTAPAVGGGGNGGVDPDGVATTGGGDTTTNTGLVPAPTFAPTPDPTRAPTHAPLSADGGVDTNGDTTVYEKFGDGACVDSAGTMYRRYVHVGYPTFASCTALCDTYNDCRGVNHIASLGHCHLNVDTGVTLDGLNNNIHFETSTATGPVTAVYYSSSVSLWDCYAPSNSNGDQSALISGESVGAAACDAACASDAACAGAGGAGGQLSFSQQSFDDGELILNYYTGESRPSLFTFGEYNELVGQGVFSAVGFTAKAWYDAGLCSLNNQAWEMHMDFSFPSNQVMTDRGTEQTNNWNSYMYLMFDQGTNIGQRGDVPMSLGHANSYGNGLTIIEGPNDLRSLVQHYDTLFSWIVSRDADTGYLTLKLYRDIVTLLVVAEVRRNVAFSDSDVMDNSKVPFSMYINRMIIDYHGFYLTAGARGDRRLDSNNRRLGGNNNNDNRRHLQEGDTTVAAFDVAATLNKADAGPVALQQTAGGSITTGTSTLQALRHLQPITGLDPSGAGGGAEELLEGLFELNIEMDIPSNESSAPLSSSMTTTVVVITFGSILFVVSSMIY